MEYVELSEDGAYGKIAEGKWLLTPEGLAGWADEEGGWEALLDGKGPGAFLEAGIDSKILSAYEAVRNQMEDEFDRIGAVL